MFLKKPFAGFYSRFFTLIFFFLIITILPVIIQALHHLNIAESFKWMQKFQNQYYVNLYVILSLFCIFYTLFNSAFYAFGIVTGTSILFGIANMEKMRILHQPVLPSDLLFLKQALLITKYYWCEVSIALLFVAVFFVVLLSFKNKVKHFRMKTGPRLVMVAMSSILVFCIFTKYKVLINSINKRYTISNENWENRDNYSKNGVLYSFMMNIESVSVSKPENYTPAEINQIFSRFKNTPEITSELKPDIILYLSESFWDITKLKNLGIKVDPIPTFHSIEKTGAALELISPTFGGNTCDAEFEIMTGMNNRFFPYGARAYSEYIHRSTPSIVQVFKENGYKTTALHTFKKWFWNRGNVYRYFGFDSFVGLEDLTAPQKKGYYVSDMELAKLIIEQAKTQSQPNFIFALSMQNHGPYSGKRYDSLDYPLQTSLSKEAEMELNNYLQGLKDADESLREVKKYIDRTDRPTLLIFLGDHLPGFSKLYSEIDYSDLSRKDSLFLYRVKAVLYANFPVKRIPQTELSMSYLPLVVTDLAQVSTPPFYTYLKNMKSQYPVISKKIPNANSVQYSTDKNVQADLLDSYWLAMYDILFGKQYSDSFHHIHKAPQVITQSFSGNNF